MPAWINMEPARIDTWIDKIYDRAQWICSHNENNEYGKSEKANVNMLENVIETQDFSEC